MQCVVKRFKEENQIESKVRKGRPRKLGNCDKNFTIKKNVKNSLLRAAKISAEFKEKFSISISPETV